MTVRKFSKFDIPFIRERYPSERITKSSVTFVGQKKIKPIRIWAWSKVTTLATALVAIVLVFQTLIYLSSARSAQGEILGTATAAYSELQAASQDLAASNFSAASGLFASAQNNIHRAQERLNDYRPLTWFASQASSADRLLRGAALLSQAGQKLSLALGMFNELKISNPDVAANRELLSQTRNLVFQASEEFYAVDSIPFDYQQTVDMAKQQVGELGLILDKLVSLEDLYLSLFSGQKTYLLIFQNYDEARATGGFIGTYGVLKTTNGSIQSLKIESIYHLDSQIYQQIAAPGPFQPAISKWGIRDANWFADFPTSAKKLLNFFELGKETADGVISVTPQLFENLLSLTGPIEMPDYHVTLSPENFQETVQYKTSVDYDRELNQPKKFLADFAEILLERLANLQPGQWFGAGQVLANNLQQKHILLYSKDSNAQKKIADLNFDGRVLPTDYDYLSVINTNLGGTKTDLSINQTINLKSKILSDTSIINIVTITRKNLAAANNLDYLRILVPRHSQFISATGFDQYDYHNSEVTGYQTDPDLLTWDIGQMDSNVYSRMESGKTEFAGWVNTDPGQSRSVTVTYALPFKVVPDQGYSLLVQKQLGSKPTKFAGSLSLGQFRARWIGEGIKPSGFGGTLKFSSNTNLDDFWPLVITK